MDAPFNPFSTSRIRPGALPFVFPADWTATKLVHQLAHLGWRAEIVGPHGSGKSSLLEALMPALEAAQRDVRRFTLRNRQRRLPISWIEFRSWTPRTLVVVDGYEQLGFVARRLLDLRCAVRGAGLLVTCHHSMGLPLLWETRTSVALLTQLAATLTQEIPSQLRPSAQQLQEAFDRAAGNVREALLTLYDISQSQQG